jgi:hypothetical protein
VPEQINIQIASGDTVVISWVTFELDDIAPTDPPVVVASKSASDFLADSSSDGASTIKGVTHLHTTAGGRIYYMHFVRLSGLQEHATYFYTVQSGGKGAAVSDRISFRAPYTSGQTKIDIFGDMGIYEWNNMEWLHKDCATGTDADLIVHMGDHSYSEGDGDETRADAYMAGYQPTLSQCPWMPLVGNHEYFETKLSRYLNSTWEGWGPIAGGNVTAADAAAAAGVARKTTGPAPNSPPHSALGSLLSIGNHHSAGTHGSTPSHSSRYFSVDFGSVQCSHAPPTTEHSLRCLYTGWCT